MSLEDETGYTNKRGSFIDGQAWFRGEVLGSQLIPTNPDFESYTGTQDDGNSDTFTDWVTGAVDDPSGDKVEATATSQTGSNAVKITRTVGNPLLQRYFTAFTEAGKTYKLEFWTRGDGAGSLFYYVYGGADGWIINSTNTGITGTTYQKVTAYFTCPDPRTGYVLFRVWIGSGYSTAYIDNVTLQEVTADLASQFANTGYQLVVDDGAGNQAIGYIGEAGTGESKSALPNDVTGITKANPGVVSSIAHGLSVGHLVYFHDLTEMTELNDTYKVVTAVGDANNFSINDTSGYGSAESTGGACADEVTEPNAIAVKIYKEPSLTTEGWASIDAGFNYNADFEFDVYLSEPPREQLNLLSHITRTANLNSNINKVMNLESIVELEEL